MKKMLFLYNPISGRGEIRHNLADVIEKFSAADYDVTVYPTKAAGDAAETVFRRASEFDMIVCSGGDGTLDEVVTGLMKSGQHRLIGYIPSGSTNDFGNSIGIPNQNEHAADLILNGKPFKSDLGLFNQQNYFVYIAAFGLMTDVSYETDQEMKNFFGHAAYLFEGVKRLGSLKSYEMEIDSEEFQESGSYIFGMVTNSNSVAGFKGLPGQNIELNDGLFEVMLVRTPKDLNHWQQAISALIVNGESNESVVRFKTKRITFRSPEPVSWTRDGENGGEHAYVELENLPKAMEIMTAAEKEAPEKAIQVPEKTKGETSEETPEENSSVAAAVASPDPNLAK